MTRMRALRTRPLEPDSPSRLCLALAVAVFLTPAALRAQDEIFSDDFERGDFSAWSQVAGAAPRVFRFSDLDLRDPHLFAPVVIIVPLCLDVTDDSLAGFSFNGSLQDQITADADADGFLDLSSLLLFRPFDSQAVGERVDFDGGMCTAPIATTTCASDPLTDPLMTSFDAIAAGTCLEALPGTTSGYPPAVIGPTAPCFVTFAETVPFQLGDLTVTLEDVQIAAAFAGDLPTALDSGLIRGFLSETDADALLLPADLPVVGGQPLSVLLPGGTGSCATGDDRDMNDGVSGWWFYFDFEAARVPYIGG